MKRNLRTWRVPRQLGGLICLLLCWTGAVAGAEVRTEREFNREWVFRLGDFPEARLPGYDDAKWERVGLPHSFSIPYFAAGNSFPVGFGWYRKRFLVPSDWRGRCLFLDFEGAFQVAEIYLNGHPVGHHRGGYTGFEVEITAAVQPGENIVAVRVDNRWDPQLAPRAGEHTFSGGLYRNVRLVVTDPLHIAWYGTFVTTPRVSAEAGTVNVKTEISNESAQPRKCTLRTVVVDPAGEIVASVRTPTILAAGGSTILDQTTPAIRRPRLWTPEHPTLYRVVSTVEEENRSVDQLETAFGFRWFEWTKDRGFFLNGEHRYFRGANVHQDHAGWGDAITDAGAARDVKLMKDAGFDFVRGSHYPHSPAFSRACDEQGLLFWSENCFWGTAGFSSPWGSSAYPSAAVDQPGFEASVRASLQEMIRIHRNHPSIVAWSMGNEVFFSDQTVMPRVRKFLAELVAETHRLDPTRPAAIGGVQRGDLDKIGDVAGYNGDGARLPQFLDPGVANVVSEYGSTIADRPGEYLPGWGDLPTVTDKSAAEAFAWRFPWRSGEVIWCGFDHGSLAGRRFGAMGVVDYFRLPKRQWYWYRNEYRHIPPPDWPTPGLPFGLTLATDRATITRVDGTDDAQIIVTVVDQNGRALSNCPPITLSVESGPGEFPTGPTIAFAPNTDIPVRDGQAAIEFRSYYAGETLIRASSPGLRDAVLHIVSRGAPRFVAGQTPPAPRRTYTRYMGEPGGPAVVLGLENPTRASSETPGHASHLANDGNRETFWQAVTNDPQPWWRVDLERMVALTQARIVFPVSGEWKYRVEISDNGVSGWRPIAAREETLHSGRSVELHWPEQSAHGRFLRISLTHWPEDRAPAIAEVELHGMVLPQ